MEGVSVIMEILRRLLRFPVTAPPDAVVIDQGVYFDSLELRQQRWREDEEEEERQRLRVAMMVWEWARDVVRYRCKRPLPPKLPRAGVVRVWLDGLLVQEIFALSQADGFAILHHIYGSDRITNVRVVQALPVSRLRFPALKPEPDFSRPGSGGGPRRK
jgi:hypothetical protein